jgi:AcrR family transcriptional regulator
MDGFERRKEQSKESIRKAAGELFAKFSVGKVSINDIARKAGVSQATIYNNFGSKDGLIQDYIQTVANGYFEHFREISKANKPYAEKVEDVVQYMIEMGESGSGYDDVEIMNNPRFKQFVDSLLNQVRTLFLEFIREGKREGYDNQDISDEAMEAYIEIFTQGINTNPELHARTHHDPKLFHDLLMIMLYGLARVK